MKLDTTDKQLLAILQSDAKQNIKEIAAALNLSKTPVYDRIKRLENAGLIEKYVAVLDRSKLKNTMVVFCSVSLESQKLTDLEKFAAEIKGFAEVMECFLMGGVNDFLLKVVVEDLQMYHQFSSGKLANLSNIAQIKSTFVFDEIKRSTVLPIF